MPVRFRHEFQTRRGRNYRIEIWDTDYSGPVIQYESGASGFEIRWAAESGLRVQQIVGSECTIEMRLDTADHELMIEDLAASSESRFSIQIHERLGISPSYTYTLEFAGVVASDIVKWEDVDKAFVSIRATDGLGLLKDVPYEQSAGNIYTGRDKIIDVIVRILNKMSHVPTHYASGDHLLSTSIDWWHVGYTYSSTNDPLALTYCMNEAFFRRSTQKRTVYTCYEVLDKILLTFGARMIYMNGVYMIEQLQYRTGSYYARKYSRAGASLGASSISTTVVVNQGVGAAALSYITYEFLPPLSMVSVNFVTGTRRNLLDYGSITYNTPISSNGGQTTVRLSGQLAVKVQNLSFLGNVNTPGLVEVKLKVRIGDRWLRRGYTISNYQVQYSTLSWESSEDFVMVVLPIATLPTLGTSTNLTLTIDITSPPIPVDGEDYQYTSTVVGVRDYNGTLYSPTTLLGSSVLNNAWLEVYSFGTPDTNETNELYSTTNPTAGNTAAIEYEVPLGDASNPNSVGRLMYQSGSNYPSTTLWGEGTNTRNMEIGKLLSQIVLSGQAVPTRKMNGTIQGGFSKALRIDWAGFDWLFLSGTWNAQQELTTGDWVQLNYTAGISPNPVIIKTFPTNDDPTLPGTSGNSQSIDSQMTAMPPATILQGVAANTNSSALSAGSVTSLPITEAVGAGEYITGDEVTIVHPLTGQTETLTVSADSTNGATTLSVTGTLVGNYPVGSYIIKKKKTGYQLNDIRRTAVTAIGTSIVVTCPASEQPRKDEHLTLWVGRLKYTTTEGDFTVTKGATTFTLNSVNADCSGLNGVVEWYY